MAVTVGSYALKAAVTVAAPALRGAVLKALSDAGIQVADNAADEVALVVCDSGQLTKGDARRRPATSAPYVAIVMGDDRDEARRAVAAGANGVVLEASLDALPGTLAAVAAGQVVVPSALRRAVTKPVLTARERQIMALVVMGFSNREIAEQLFLAESTVKSHLFSVFRRLGVKTRKEAAALILDNDLGVGSGILSIS